MKANVYDELMNVQSLTIVAGLLTSVIGAYAAIYFGLRAMRRSKRNPSP